MRHIRPYTKFLAVPALIVMLGACAMFSGRESAGEYVDDATITTKIKADILGDPALKVLQVVGGRLRRLVGIIEELSFTTVRHRLISWILRRAKAESRTITLGVTHQELASQIGTVRELVSRNMARLQAQGLIEIRGQELTILDMEGLEADLNS